MAVMDESVKELSTPKSTKSRKTKKSENTPKISSFFSPKSSPSIANKSNETTPKISSFFSPKSSSVASKPNVLQVLDMNSKAQDGEAERSRVCSGESLPRPDSGFSSRAETPLPRMETPTLSSADAPNVVRTDSTDSGIQADVAPSPSQTPSSLSPDPIVRNCRVSIQRMSEQQKTIYLAVLQNSSPNVDESDDELSDEEESEEESESESDWDGDSDDGFKKAAKKPAKKIAKRSKKVLQVPMQVPGALKKELSEFEQIRENNIKEREAMYALLMEEMDEFKKDCGLKTAAEKAKPKKKRTFDEAFKRSGEMPTQLRKSSRLAEMPEGGFKEEQLGSQKWDYEKREFRLAEEDSDYDEEDYQTTDEVEVKKKRTNPGKWELDPNEGYLMPEDITKAMLKKIHYRGTKKYNTTLGTCCHQCRQKTMDTKTICRSGNCVGIRGKFCGSCLRGRYGEDVAEALMDPHWSCPVCRGFCNCSICRNRNGKGATGILIHLAQSKGFDNVADYLKHLAEKKGKSS